MMLTPMLFSPAPISQLYDAAGVFIDIYVMLPPDTRLLDYCYDVTPPVCLPKMPCHGAIRCLRLPARHAIDIDIWRTMPLFFEVAKIMRYAAMPPSTRYLRLHYTLPMLRWPLHAATTNTLDAPPFAPRFA